MKRLVFVLSLTLCTLWLQGFSFPEPHIDVFAKFKRFSIDDGLSHNHVTDIIQDGKGYLWLATANGLNKFDGHTFRTYTSDSISFLPSNVILDLENDKYGRLWVATREGLCYYHRESDRFVGIQNFLSDSTSLPDSHIRSVLADGDFLWAHTLKGYLLRINTKTNELVYWKNSSCKQEYYLYDALYKTPEDLIYYGGRQCGPYVFHSQDNKHSKCNCSTQRGINDVSDFYQDKDSVLWMTAIDGIYTLNKKTKRFDRVIRVSAFQVMEDKDDHLWFATARGLWHYNPKTNELLIYRHHEDVGRTLSSNRVNCIFKDKAGNMWVGTDAGLNLFLPENEWLTHLDHQAALDKSLSSNHITAAIQLNDGEIWLGTKSKGINKIDPLSLNVEHVLSNGKDTKGLASMSISDFYEDNKRTVWIGLWSGTGFQKYNTKTDNYQLIVQDPTSTSMDWYNDFMDSGDGKLWVAPWGGHGLCKIDKNALRMPETRADNPFLKILPSRLNTCLEKGGNNELFIGTTDTGLFVLNEKTNDVEVYREGHPNENQLWGTPINDLYFDDNNKLWVATDLLNCFDTKTKTFTHYLTEEKFRNLHIKRIIQAEHSKLWLATNMGIVVFDFESKDYTLLSTANKLPFNDFSKASILLDDGRMLFAGNKGAILFYPDRILEYDIPPECIQVTRITEFNNELYHDATITGTFLFNHNNRHLTFHLADLGGYCQSERQYEYQLKGFHKEWLEAEKNQRSITISNLKHGKYELLVREKNTANSTSSFTVIKSPSFWETIIFWVLVGVLVIGLLILYFIIQHRRVLAENKALISQQRLLRSQMNPHFIFNAISAIQNDILKKPPRESVKHLSKFAALIRQFLDSSKRDLVELSVENTLLRNYLEIQQLRYSYKFDYTIDIDDNINADITLVPPLLSQAIIENSIEHGLKQLKGNGSVHLHYLLKGDVIIVSIDDNGVGFKNAPENDINMHKSFAIKAIQERLRILHKKKKENYFFEIINKSDLNTREQGTLVRFSIPLIKEF